MRNQGDQSLDQARQSSCLNSQVVLCTKTSRRSTGNSRPPMRGMQHRQRGSSEIDQTKLAKGWPSEFSLAQSFCVF
jgi:hypothetical protein